MCAARVNDEQTIGSSIYPDMIFLLEFCIDAESKFRRISNLEQSIWLE